MSESRHVLYHSFPFRSSRCAWLVSELGVSEQIDVEKVSLHGNAEGLNQYQKEVHPYRTIPALKLPSGEVILESGGICLYLADRFASEAKTNNLLPTSEEIGTYYNVRDNSFLSLTYPIFLTPMHSGLYMPPLLWIKFWSHCTCN